MLIKEFMTKFEVPVCSGQEGADSQIMINKEHEALRERMESISYNQEMVDEMMRKFCECPNAKWKFCHHAFIFLYLKTNLSPIKWSISRVRQAIWRQTIAVQFGVDVDEDEVGYNPNQTFRSLPSAWVQEPFGLNFYAVHSIKLQPKEGDDVLTSSPWKKRTRVTRSPDPLNYWIGNYRQDVLPSTGVELRSKQTMICYFASPRASLTSAGVFRDESDKNLTDA